MKVSIKFIPHKQQRYDTVGDWDWKRGRLVIRVSKMSDWRYEWLVALHELIECILCKLADIKQKDIDRFDMVYEEHRAREQNVAACGCSLRDEPGDDPHAPYNRQHKVATRCERLIAVFLGVNWKQYGAEVEAL